MATPNSKEGWEMQCGRVSAEEMDAAWGMFLKISVRLEMVQQSKTRGGKKAKLFWKEKTQSK